MKSPLPPFFWLSHLRQSNILSPEVEITGCSSSYPASFYSAISPLMPSYTGSPFYVLYLFLVLHRASFALARVYTHAREKNIVMKLGKFLYAMKTTDERKEKRERRTFRNSSLYPGCTSIYKSPFLSFAPEIIYVQSRSQTWL